MTHSEFSKHSNPRFFACPPKRDYYLERACLEICVVSPCLDGRTKEKYCTWKKILKIKFCLYLKRFLHSKNFCTWKNYCIEKIFYPKTIFIQKSFCIWKKFYIKKMFTLKKKLIWEKLFQHHLKTWQNLSICCSLS